jgi:prepilin-type N-terminal cleavage/methylation domain-containing protein
MNKVKQSFTLVEILVVIVIIGILSSFIFFTINDSVEKANIAKSKMFSESIRNNLLLNLVGEWDFDDSSSLGKDTWGSNNMTITNIGMEEESKCVSGGCANYMDATITNYITVPINTINGLTDFTITLWMKAQRTGDRYIVSGATISSDNAMLLRSTSEDVWRFVMWKRDGTECHAYQDGIINDGLIYSCPPNPISIDSLILGQDQDSVGGGFAATQTFNGLLDEFKIYNDSVSESQVRQNYLSGLNNLYAKGLITELEYNEKLSEL